LGAAGGALIGAPPAGPSVQNPHPAADMRVLGSAALPPGSVPDPGNAVALTPAAGHRVPPRPAMRTPRERWTASVTEVPLETPRPLPTGLHAMATAITGRARPPLFTTGPATRRALAAAGALGATTGTTVHLPAVPTQVSAVLAHELAHTRNPVRRPRFLLGGMSGLLDDDERQARTAGQQAVTTGAGIVDSLPVGGGLGAVGDVATRAAKAAVLEATASPLGGALDRASSAVDSAVAGARGAVDSALGGPGGAVDRAVGGARDAVDSAVGGAVDAAGGAGTAAGRAAGAVAGAAAGAVLDPDQVVEIVERRLLREIERRGGRWAGVF
jgi:hypothetical protein